MAQDKSYHNDYYHRNKERINARRKEQYASDPEKRQKRIDAAKAWAAAHPDAAKESAKRAKARGYRKSMTAEQIANTREVTRQWRKEHKAEVTGYQNARRAMMREAKVGRISRRTLWAESGGVCAHCGQPIDPTIKYPDLMSLSYDHRIPLSKGGLHCQENMQCVHLVCNIKKRDSVPE